MTNLVISAPTYKTGCYLSSIGLTAVRKQNVHSHLYQRSTCEQHLCTRLNADGTWTSKATDPNYVEAYGRVAGLTPASVNAHLAARIVEAAVPPANDVPLMLDGISGATGTANRFQDLAREILAGRVTVELPHKLPRS